MHTVFLQYFVIKAQPFAFTRVLRFADVLMENDRKIMERLDKRHLITPEVFEVKINPKQFHDLNFFFFRTTKKFS